MSAAFLTKLSYCLLVCGVMGIVAAVVLYRKLELSRAWHILFAVPLPQKPPKQTTKPKQKSKTAETAPAPTQRLVSEDTVVLYEETLIHTSEVI